MQPDAIERALARPDFEAALREHLHHVDGDGAGDGEPSMDCPAWPDPMAAEALIGPAGEFVRMLEPHTEADPAAVLLQFLVGMGVLVGRSAHSKVEADQHYCNLFAVLVGLTSKSRKGTSWGHVRELLRLLDPELHDKRIESGLSSGEGLVWAVRDAIGDEDPGESDKRLLVMEPEFARVLSVAEREGNTLSAVVRQAWDEGRLRTLTKKQAARSTDAHIGILGHITRDELRATLSNTAVANGFANRFLWACVRRSKNLPEGGGLDPGAIQALALDLARVVDFSRNIERLCRDDVAKQVWASVYDDLSEGKPGLLGAVTSRAEAQVLRLSLLYALLDQSPVVRSEHVRAGLAVWNYCEASARFIFGDALGNPTADDIRQALRNVEGRGMTRSELREYFARHKSSGEISRALALLAEYGSVRRVVEKTDGRPAESWFYVAR